ncbi:hypothetical protein FHT44_005125 [Mycolicibacterium sp. BK634]|uniref:hypothetical protein n=1 Tax=Mycolicibacterium sp. BK634 TaxID=2587099 RepID=UPI001608648A|nr:hypothetical protein [Mycolicibacterium sp. BK634]MBB3752613.1 hypothetical protein [Mycolicibacterium sp. BK634]
MGVDRTRLRVEIENEIREKAPEDPDVKRQTREFALEVRDYARMRALQDMDRGYATGHFVESIQIQRLRRWWRKTMPNWRIFSDDPKSHMLEDGTGDDAPGTHSPWGRFTPTPAYHTFAKTAFHFGGTPDGGVDEIEV